MPQLEMMPENMKMAERGKYEEAKSGEIRSRHTSVVSSGTSVLRSTLHEAPKSQVSPGIYEDSNARRTPVTYQSMSRSSPMMNRVTEGVCVCGFLNHGVSRFGRGCELRPETGEYQAKRLTNILDLI